MYFVKYGKEYLYDPRVQDCVIFEPSLECEENTCGFFDFTIYPDHPLYDKLKERDSSNPVEVYDDDILLFAGFIYELGKEFYLSGQVKCKGELAYLKESIVRPYSTIQRGYGSTVPTTVNGYFEWLIYQHNAQVDSTKQFKIGINQGYALDINNYIYRESNQYPNTLDEINEKILNELGGYLRIRHENGERYIDLLYEWTDENAQILDFGINLTDYNQTDSSLDVYTYVIPLGAKMKDTEYSYFNGYFVTQDTTVDPEKDYYEKKLNDGVYTYSLCYDLKSFVAGVTYYEYDENYDESELSLTISDIEDGPIGIDDYKKVGDYIYCISAVNKYGFIGYTYEDQDITTTDNLIVAAILSLKSCISPIRTIEIKAVDMHLVNPDIKPIRVGEYVRVRSNPHKFDSYMLCTSITLNLDSPSNSVYTLGTTFDTLTGEQNKRIKALNEKTNKQIEKAEALLAEVKQTAKDASTTANNAKEESSLANKEASSAMDAVRNTVINTVTEYAISLDPKTEPTEGWSIEAPEWSSKVFIWSRLVMTYGNGSTDIGPAVCITGNSGQDGEDAIVLRIDSSKGTVFKNNSMSTVLSVVIYKGSELINNITDLHRVFGSGAYLEWYWQKLDDDTFGVILSTDEKIGNSGFMLTISPEDVNTKVTFRCELIK